MNTRSHRSKAPLWSTVLTVLLIGFASTTQAQEVMRLVRFTAAGTEQQQAAMKLVDTEINKLYLAAKGFKSVKFYIDTKTLETGSVTVWASRADVDAFVSSPGYKPIPGKLAPLMKGSMTSYIVEVHEPKK